MRIDGARRQGNELCLATTDTEAWRWLYAFKPGEYQLKAVTKRRSLDANAYAWVLIGKIAGAVRLTTEEVYRREIREIGEVYDVVCVQNVALDRLVQNWEEKGLGWQAEPFPSKTPGCTNVRLFYGSSVYDTRQMSILIDRLVQEAQALDIETLSDRELSLLKEAWK